jgi:hypothetical protein
VVKNGLAVGAMSYAFMKCLGAFLAYFPFQGRGRTKSAADANPKQSYQQLLKSVREILRKNYSQKPQLSSSHKIVRLPSFPLLSIAYRDFPWTGYQHAVHPLITTYHDKLSLHHCSFDGDVSVAGLVFSFLDQYCTSNRDPCFNPCP